VEGTRELVIVRTPYMVIYHIENDAAVVIDRVLHSA
jgi:plasmid stabilization system protein ParE